MIRLYQRAVVLACLLGLYGIQGAAGQTVEKDTLDWRRYYPLAVGNVWEYVGNLHQQGDLIQRIEILGDTLVGRWHYFRLERTHQFFDYNIPNRYTDYIAYDTSRARYILRKEGSLADTTEFEGPCPNMVFEDGGSDTFDLDLAFGTRIDCGVTRVMTIEGAYDTTIAVGSQFYEVASYKRMEEVYPRGGFWIQFYHYAADIGFLGGDSNGPAWLWSLTYAYVDGVAYGEEALASGPLPAEASASQPTGSVAPHPVAEQATLTYTTPRDGPVDLVLYDLLGRRVWAEALGWRAAGTHRHDLAVGGLAPGSYHLVLLVAGRPTRMPLIKTGGR